MRLKCRRYLLPTLLSIAASLAIPVFGAVAFAQTSSFAAPVPSRLTQPIDETHRLALPGTVHRLANAANDRGIAPDGMPLERVHVVLKRSDAQEAALKQAIADMHTPGAAAFHQWLTPEQFGQRFGPSDADIQTLTAWLGDHGFSVTKINPGKQTLEISGTAGQFRDTFQSQIHAYQVNGQTHYANATDPQIPAALAPVFGGFASLNNFQLKSTIKTLGKAQFNTATHAVTPSWTEGLSGLSFVLAPGDFAKQYDLTPLYSAGTNGTGQTIAIVNESNISLALVNQYRSLFGLSVNPPVVIIDGNDPGIDGVNNPDGPNYASVEAYLDVEEAGAVAPGATIDLVIGADTALESGLILAAEHAVYGNIAPVISVSFGECEASQGASENAFINSLWEEAAAQGQTVLVSSGDNGSAGCDNDNSQQYAVFGQAVNGLSSTPYNVSVGGTDFYYSTYSGTSAAQSAQLATYWSFTPSNLTPTVSLLQVVPEQPWNNSQYGLNLFNQYLAGDGTTIAGGSGGASNCATGTPGSGTGGSGGTCAGYAKPAWQTALTPADKVRDLPDVSLFASNGVNYSFYPICAEDGDCQPASAGGEVQIFGVGGTSASTPAFAGIMALVNQKYGPQGQADFVLYPLAKQYPAAFHDVVNGTNSMPCATATVHAGAYSYPPVNCIAVTSPATATDSTFGTATEGQIGTGTTPEYNAVAGYDLATGLGSVDANVLVTNWNNIKFTSSSVTLTPSQTTFAHGTAVTVSGAVTPGAATGNVALMTTSTEPLNASETSFALSGGTYTGSVNYFPGGTYTIYGMYSGDGTYGASTSSKTSITVTPEASATVLTPTNTTGTVAFSNGASLPYGTQILLEAQPGSVNSANTTTSPTGSVKFLNGTATLATVPLNVEGLAEFNYAPPPSATPYSITAQYSGDNSYNASTSSAVTFTITQDTPAISLTSGTQTGTTITAISGTTTLTVGVENYANAANQAKNGYAYNNSAVAPTGSVKLTGLPSGALYFQLQPAIDPNTLFAEGTGTVVLPSETAGTYTVTASYAGDANYAATTATFSVTITASTLLPTTTTATSSVTSTTTTTNPTLTATVTGSTSGGFPTGRITFFDGGVELGYLTLPASGSGSTVSETISLNGDLQPGANVLTVQYSGNSVYAPSVGTVTIVNGGAPYYTLGVPSATISLAPGGSTTQTITVTPANGFTGAVALSCAITGGTTNPPACSLPTPLTFTSSSTAAASATLTVTTTSTTPAGSYGIVVTAINGTTTQTATIPLTVTGPPSFTVAGSGTITVTAGSNATSNITVTPANGFTGVVTLGCVVTATGGTGTVPTCTAVNPPSITGTTAVTGTITVAAASGVLGSFSAQVTATSGSLTSSVAIPINVTSVAATPAIALANSGAITIPIPGGTGSTTLTVTPSGGFTGSVALTCAVTPTNETDTPTCTVASPLSITSTSSQTATLTVSTTAASAAIKLPGNIRTPLLPIGGGIAVAALLLLAPIRRRRWASLLGATLALTLALGFSTGCGSSNSVSANNPGNPGTTLGAYTVTVTGSASGVTTQTTTVSVTLN
jgi:subtilase family serine protease